MGLGNDSSMRTSKRHQRVLRKFECGNCLLSRDRRKIIEKLLDRISCLKIVDEILEGYSRTGKNNSASLNFWVGRNDLIHSHTRILPLMLGALQIVPSNCGAFGCRPIAEIGRRPRRPPTAGETPAPHRLPGNDQRDFGANVKTPALRTVVEHDAHEKVRRNLERDDPRFFECLHYG